MWLNKMWSMQFRNTLTSASIVFNVPALSLATIQVFYMCRQVQSLVTPVLGGSPKSKAGQSVSGIWLIPLTAGPEVVGLNPACIGNVLSTLCRDVFLWFSSLQVLLFDG